MSRWEVFDCRNGKPVHVVPWLWLARLLKRRNPWFDYARPGAGWTESADDWFAQGCPPSPDALKHMRRAQWDQWSR